MIRGHLLSQRLYSTMLYMKTRVTFRLAGDLARDLRELPNQTQFVEAALREALGVACPLCQGSGRRKLRRMQISNFRQSALPRLGRESALELRRLVRVGRQLSATDLELQGAPPGGVHFVLTRGREVLLTGKLRHAEHATHTPTLPLVTRDPGGARP